MAALSLILPAGYGLVLLEALVIAAHCVSEGFAGFGVRKRVFSKQFFATNFPELKPAPEDGYPDIGYGRYSDKLPQRDWEDLANAQRAHYNYVEQLPAVLTSLVSSQPTTANQPTSHTRPLSTLTSLPCYFVWQCIAGLTYPRVSVLLGAGILVGRYLYGTGYRSKGSRARLPGVLIVDVSMVGLLIAGGMSAWSVGGGLQGMQNALTAFTKF